MRPIFRTLAALSVLLVATLARAEAPLADIVPADAQVYIGWRGSNALGAQYDKSNLKGVLDAVGVQNFIDAAVKEATAKAGANAPKLEGLKLFTELGADIAKYPTAFYFGGVDLTGEKPVPKFALIVKAGKDRAAVFAAQIQKTADANRQPGSPPSAAKVAGDYVVVTVGEIKSLAPLLSGTNDATFRPLSARKEFVAAMGEVSKDPAFVAFASVTDLLKLADDAVALKGDTRAKDMWPKVMDILGVDGARYAIWAGGFDGAEWSSQAFVSLKDRRTGVIALLDNKPLSDDALQLIPKAAAWGGAVRFDGDRIVTDLREASTRLFEDGASRVDSALQMIAKITGVDFHKDLLASFGDEWLYYGLPPAAGARAQRFVVVNKLRNAAAAEQALGDLELFVAGVLAQRNQDGIDIATERAGEMKVHVISWKANGGGKVAWTIQNDTWYFALSPEAVQAAVEHVAKKGANVTENAAYIQMRKTLGGGAKIASFSFNNLPVTAEQSYGLMLRIVDKMQGNKTDATVVLPAYEKVKAYIAPMGSITWSDAQGWHLRSHGPFPGAFMFNGMRSLFNEAILRNLERKAAAKVAPVEALP